MSNVLHALCDAGAAGATEKIDDISRPRLVIATTILASSLAFIDGSVVNVGLPAIAASFQARVEFRKFRLAGGAYTNPRKLFFQVAGFG